MANGAVKENIYSDLPQFVTSKSHMLGLKSKYTIKKDFVSAFLKKHLPRNRLIKSEDEKLKYKVEFLDNTGINKRKKFNFSAAKRKTITNKEKKELKLFNIKPDGQSYESYLPLHNLWKDYIKDVIQFKSLQQNNYSMATQKLLKADLHGCLMTVQRSKCPSYVGATGIVLQESRNTFKIITTNNKIKCIPKMNSVFAVEVEGFCFTIYGNHFRVKASERTVRKFKAKATVDL